MQQRLALQACYAFLSQGTKRISTGQAYDAYRSICSYERIAPLTQRRFSDLLGFLDLYGLINARVISKGRYGSTREISSSLSDEVSRKLLNGTIWQLKLKVIVKNPAFPSRPLEACTKTIPGLDLDLKNISTSKSPHCWKCVLASHPNEQRNWSGWTDGLHFERYRHRIVEQGQGEGDPGAEDNAWGHIRES